MRRNLCKVSLRFQLHTLIFIMIAGLILVTLFYYWSFNHLTLQSTNEYFTTISDLLYSRVEMIDYQFSRTVEAISTNKALQRYVAAGEDEEGEISAYVENLFLDAIQPSGRSMAYNGIRGIALVKKNAVSVIGGSAGQELQQIAAEYRLTDGIIYFTPVYTHLYASADRERMFYGYIQPIQYRTLLGEDYSAVQAYCLYLCDAGVIQEALLSTTLPKDAEVFLYNYDGKILASTDKTHAGNDIVQTFGEDFSWKDISKSIQPLTVDGVNYLANQQPVGTGEWQMVLMVPQERLTRDMYPIRVVGIVLGTCIGCFFILLCLVIIRTISYQISDLAAGMEKVGNFDVPDRLATDQGNELSAIAEQINCMLDRVEKSAAEALAAKEMLYVNELERQHAEMYALQSQIYPHFSYNTLECIRSIALYHGVEEISRIATAMGNIFRYCVAPNDFATLQEELNCVQEYFNILQIRFDGRLQLQLEIPEEYYQTQIPKMILQPVVENAVYHGLERVYRNGLLSISCERTGEYLTLKIVDNGCGMEHEQFTQLEEQLRTYQTFPAPSTSSGIGLLNIQRRLKVLYGDSCGVWIYSQKDVGTTVNLVIKCTPS